jgi:alpha-methylacyl-CoA racemase
VSTALPLTGVKVLDLTRFPPGAFCTVLLADLGADVCRVETPGSSSEMSGIGVGIGRSKRSVGVDLRNPNGLAILRRLAAWADVLVENNRPGELDERGFGYTHAAVELPGLIWCSISGFGQDGPAAQLPGHDISYTAHSGLLSGLNPQLPWHPQLVMAIPIGASMAAVGIVAALRERDRTGVGCQLDISLSEAATWLLSSDDAMLNGTARGIPVTPDRHLYECGDGRWITTAAADPKSWKALCLALGLDDLVGTLWRWDDAAAVTDRIAAVFLTRPAGEWVAELGPLGAAVTALNRGVELQDDPQVRARGTLVPVGDVVVPANPIRFRDANGALSQPPPTPPVAAGAHTDTILAEVGFSTDEIAELRASGAIGG